MVSTLKTFEPWNGDKKNFRCGFCGHKFKLGEEYRRLYTNDTNGWGNPLVCGTCFKECYGRKEMLRLRWLKKHEEFNSDKWWWFKRLTERE